jgi:Tol biopolymer transport system component
LSKSKQIRCIVFHADQPHSKSDIQRYAQHAAVNTLFIKPEENALSWWLYDTIDAERLQANRLAGTVDAQRLAQRAADEIMPVLVGTPSSFRSRIAYIERKQLVSDVYASSVYVIDPDGTHKRCLITGKTICTSPAWNNDELRPHILFSQLTPHGSRLLALNAGGTARVVMEGDGTFAGVSYAAQRSEVVYCRSGVIWLQRYNKKTKKSEHERLFTRGDYCTNPTLLNNGDVVYVYKSGVWRYNRATQAHERLTPVGELCVAATCHEASGMLAYTRLEGGRASVWTCKLDGSKQSKVAGDSLLEAYDPTWSPCGMYLAYITCNKAGVTALETAHSATHAREVLVTSKPDSELATPSWSPWAADPF